MTKHVREYSAGRLAAAVVGASSPPFRGRDALGTAGKMPTLLGPANTAGLCFYFAVPAALTTAVFFVLALAATTAFGLQ
jgi:hypothetical protein